MKTTTKALGRSLCAACAASAVGGAAAVALAVPSATAATDPCAASEVARTIGSVATSTGTYLDSHPETNQALTTISQQQGGALPASPSPASAVTRTASRTGGNHHPLVPCDAHSVAGETAELRFQTFSRLVKRKARKSAPFLLS